jgi:hypothetical protein
MDSAFWCPYLLTPKYISRVAQNYTFWLRNSLLCLIAAVLPLHVRVFSAFPTFQSPCNSRSCAGTVCDACSMTVKHCCSDRDYTCGGIDPWLNIINVTFLQTHAPCHFLRPHVSVSVSMPIATWRWTGFLWANHWTVGLSNQVRTDRQPYSKCSTNCYAMCIFQWLLDSESFMRSWQFLS